MSTITKFSSAVIKDVFRKDFAKFIEGFGEKHGVSFEFPQTISYIDEEFNLRLKVSIKNKRAGKTSAASFTIPTMIVGEDGLLSATPANGTKFKGKANIIYTVTGYNKRCSRFPVQAQSPSGRGIKCTVDYVNHNKI